jgi:type I restriction enzyme R subunit
MPFGANNEHVPVRLIDLDDLKQNQYIVTQQFIYRAGPTERRADMVLLVNGLPLVLIEAKTPVKKCISWVDGAVQVHDDYEKTVPELFVCNVFSVATEARPTTMGRLAYLSRIGVLNLDGGDEQHHPLKSLKLSAESMLRPHVVLDILGSFTLFATDKKKAPHQDHQPLPAVRGGQQDRRACADGLPSEGPDLAFSRLRQVATDGVRRAKVAHACRPEEPHGADRVDRIDSIPRSLAPSLARTFPTWRRLTPVRSCSKLLTQDARKIIITTIFKFAEATGNLNGRSNIIALVDEAHRTQEGDLGRKMREALPNAFLFGLTGTPINRADRNTFYAFGADEDEKGYMSRYGFEDRSAWRHVKTALRARLVDLHIDKVALDAATRI